MTDIILSNFNILNNSLDTIYDYCIKNRVEIRISQEIDIINFVSYYLTKLNLDVHVYKNNNKIKHIAEINTIFNTTHLIENAKDEYERFILYVCESSGCHMILKSAKLDIFSQSIIESFTLLSAEKGSYPTFVYLYENILNKSMSIKLKFEIFYKCLSNGDDRIYKYMINRIIKDKIIDPTSLDKTTIIQKIFKEHIPIKYILRRLKSIVKIINLDDMIDTLLEYTKIHKYSFQLVEKILTYYYKTSISDRSITDLAQCTYYPPDSIIEPEDKWRYVEDTSISIYNTLKTSLEKNKFIFHILSLYGIAWGLQLQDIKTCIPPICMLSLCHGHFKDHYLLNCGKVVHDIFSMYPYHIISKHIANYNYNDIWRIMPFVKYFNPKYINVNPLSKVVQLNKCLLYLRVYIRKIKKYNSINKKLMITPILHELKNLKPSTKPIFKDGTHFFKNNKQNFNTIPPSNILPGQLQLLKSNSYFLKEKADGVLTNVLPSSIYPPIFQYNKIKAEYIECFDLYLVFDIDSNLSSQSIEDRYNYLRKQHPSTIDIVPSIIDTPQDLIEIIEIERTTFKKFLSEPYETYRWYPKASWKINNHDNLIDFYTDILNSYDNKWLCQDGSVKNDGLIITPFNGDRELKLKPRSLMTIDLLYQDKHWLDREGVVYNDIIVSNDDIVLSDKSIWRCYPYNSSYQPHEIRHDKNKPNSYSVISNILCLQHIEYKSSYPSIYHSKITTSQYIHSDIWKRIITITNSIIEKMIKNIPCKNILDLGCGNGKLLRFIKDFKLYYGIDMDVNMLAKGCTKYSDENVIFNNIDLSKSWNQQGTKWNEPNPYISFDTITAINSLQHFCTDLFWEQLNIITHIGSVMVFNLVSMENNTKFEFDNSYIERIDSTIHYMYRAVHNKPMSEPYIESILSWLDKYGWEITSTYKPTEDLHSNYIWYVVTRKI